MKRLGIVCAFVFLLLCVFLGFNLSSTLRHLLAIRGSPDPLERAIIFANTNALEAILKSDRSLANKPFRGRQTPLSFAATCNNPKPTVDLLIAYGADINARSGPFNTTPLQHAAWGGKVEGVKALLAHHPDLNATNESSESGTGDGSTALNFAFVADNKEIFGMLIDAGADINRGRSVLAECMVYGGRDSWAEYLLAKGADPNRSSPKGDRFPPVVQAVLSGNTNYVGALIRYGVDLSPRYVNGADDLSLLELAMNKNRIDIALMLQNYVLEKRSNTVSFAAARDDLNMLREILQRNPDKLEEKDELGLTPLAWAAQAGQEQAADLLLSFGANPNAEGKGGRRPIDWAAAAGHLSIVHLLAERSKNPSLALFLAIQQQKVEVARYLLEQGANPNFHYPASNSTMPLHMAAGQGNVAAARLLLEHGALVDGLDQNNSLPLLYAASGFSKEMIELLFAYGATVPKNPNAWSIFQHWALGAGDTNVANVILSHGADVNWKDYNGQTPLHFAAQQGQIQAIEWLLRNGANVNARDKNGKSPLGLLRQRKGGITRPDVAELLRKSGGKE